MADFLNPALVRQSNLILTSFEATFRRPLIEISTSFTPETQAQVLFHCKIPVLSHDRITLDDGTQTNVYNYANESALHLFNRTWEQQTKLPSSASAQLTSAEQEERNALLAKCLAQGSAIFSGVRVRQGSGQVVVKEGLLWNIMDWQTGLYCGQAAALLDAHVANL